MMLRPGHFLFALLFILIIRRRRRKKKDGQEEEEVEEAQMGVQKSLAFLDAPCGSFSFAGDTTQ